MSRSYKKSPFISNCGSKLQKQFKQHEHGRERSLVKNLLKQEVYDKLPVNNKKFGNEWSSPRDGKQYLPPDYREKGMRK